MQSEPVLNKNNSLSTKFRSILRSAIITYGFGLPPTIPVNPGATELEIKRIKGAEINIILHKFCNASFQIVGRKNPLTPGGGFLLNCFFLQNRFFSKRDFLFGYISQPYSTT